MIVYIKLILIFDKFIITVKTNGGRSYLKVFNKLTSSITDKSSSFSIIKKWLQQIVSIVVQKKIFIAI